MAPALQFGKYTLIERIAAGGMAEVFRAKTYGAAGFEKNLVIKRILPHFSSDEEFVLMFIDEARIAAKLDHANIVQIFDFDSALVDGRNCFYIAMELVDGQDVRNILKEGIRTHQSLALSHCVHIAIETLNGLHYAHTRTEDGKPLDVVHRDVSPHNILVSYSGSVKLSDFGIAKAAARASATTNGLVKGKLGYMSPEQVMGKPLDRRTDIFSMGIVLYEMLTQRRLFVADADPKTVDLVRHAVVPPLRERNPQVPPDLEQVVMTMLAPNPRDRYQTADEAARALTTTSVHAAHVAAGLGEYVTHLFPTPTKATTSKTMSEKMQPPGEGGKDNSPKTMMLDGEDLSEDLSEELDEKTPPSVAATPVAEQKTAMLDPGSPEQARVLAQVQAAVQRQATPQPVSHNIAPAPKQVPFPNTPHAPAATPAPRGPVATPAPRAPFATTPSPRGPVTTPAPRAPVVTPAPHAPVAAKPAPQPASHNITPAPRAPVATPAPSILEQKTAMLDADSPGQAQVKAQIDALRGSAPPPAAPPPAGPSPVSDGQKTMMLDTQAPVTPPKRNAPVAEFRPLAPPPPPPATWPRWVIGLGIMIATASITAVASGYLLPKKTVVDAMTPPPPPPPPPIIKTKIQLATTPAHAAVTLDGKAWPHFTPTAIEGEIGKTAHVVVELEGYLPAERDVIFSENAKSLTISLDAEEKEPARPVKEVKEHKVVVKPKGVGYVSIFVRPFAVVFVDGVRKRQTPIASLEIPAGRHTIELVNEGKGKREKVMVNIKPGANPEIRRDWLN